MNTNNRYLIPLITVAIAASLSSCSSNPNSGNIKSQTPAPSATPTQTPSMAQLRAKSSNVQPSAFSTTSKTVNVTLYTSDAQCQELIPQQVSVPAKKPVTGAVGKIIEGRDTGDLSLSGYRVNVKNGIATVDLRLSPESKRQLASLSSCEQFALFGSLRKTLTSNAQWNIKEVRFTELGEEIVL